MAMTLESLLNPHQSLHVVTRAVPVSPGAGLPVIAANTASSGAPAARSIVTLVMRLTNNFCVKYILKYTSAPRQPPRPPFLAFSMM